MKDYTLKRTDDLKTRYYYKVGADNPTFYISVTTWQKRVLPMSPGLLHWIKNMTPEEQDQVLLETSSYGTFFHYLAKEYADSDRTFPIQQLPEWIDSYRQGEDGLMVKDTQGWEKKASNDLYALNQFFTERNVAPLIIDDEPMTEVALAYDPGEGVLSIDEVEDINLYPHLERILGYYSKSPAFPFAGALDLVCELDFNGSRVKAIVDYKTGRIWPSHPFQLEAYKLLWNANFPEQPIEYIFNFRPKDWNKTKQPTYELKNQSEAVNPQEMAALYILAQQWINPEPGLHIEYTDIKQGEGTWEAIRANEYYKQEA